MIHLIFSNYLLELIGHLSMLMLNHIFIINVCSKIFNKYLITYSNDNIIQTDIKSN